MGVTSSAQPSSIPPWQQTAGINDPGMALGRKVLSLRAPNKQESCLQRNLRINYVQVSWDHLPESISTKGFGRRRRDSKMETGSSESSQVS